MPGVSHLSPAHGPGRVDTQQRGRERPAPPQVLGPIVTTAHVSGRGPLNTNSGKQLRCKQALYLAGEHRNRPGVGKRESEGRLPAWARPKATEPHVTAAPSHWGKWPCGPCPAYASRSSKGAPVKAQRSKAGDTPLPLSPLGGHPPGLATAQHSQLVTGAATCPQMGRSPKRLQVKTHTWRHLEGCARQ